MKFKILIWNWKAFLEESMGNNAGDFQGSSIDVVNLNDIETYRQTAAKIAYCEI